MEDDGEDFVVLKVEAQPFDLGGLSFTPYKSGQKSTIIMTKALHSRLKRKAAQINSRANKARKINKK